MCMSRRYIRQREQREKRKIARERIDVLFTLAERVFPYEPKLADRYVEVALAIQRKAKIRMPRKWKRHYCKRCHSFLVPGVTARVRLRDGHIVTKCLKCGHIMRYPYLNEQRDRRKKRTTEGTYSSP